MFPIERLQLDQDKFLADFHRDRPKDFNEVRNATKRLPDYFNRVVELGSQYEEFFQNMKALGINITISKPLPVGGRIPVVPTITRSEASSGDWFPLEELATLKTNIDAEVENRQKKPRNKAELDRCVAVQMALAPAAAIRLEWLDWHFLVYGLRCCFGHPNGKATLGLDPAKVYSCALPAARRLKLQTFLVAMSHPDNGVKKGREFARAMLALYDAACHRRECLGGIDAANPCRYCIAGICTYALVASNELFDAVHLWYPRLARRCAHELTRSAALDYPAIFAGYKPKKILAAHRAVTGFEGYASTVMPATPSKATDQNKKFLQVLVVLAGVVFVYLVARIRVHL